LILVGASLLTLGYSYSLDKQLWPSRGMKLFLLMSITSLSGLILTSTKWFNNWYFNHLANKKINNVSPKVQSQASPKAKKVSPETAIDRVSPKRDNRGGSSSPINIQSESSEAAIDALKSRLPDPLVGNLFIIDSTGISALRLRRQMP
jgi:hypothetical protein